MSNDTAPAFSVEDRMEDGQCNSYGHDFVDGECTYCGTAA